MSEPISQVHEQLAVTNITAARTEPMDEYDAVVTVCQDSIEDHIPAGVEYHFFKMSDGVTDSYGGRCDYEFFEYAARTILLHLRHGDSVLVHCHAGQSRSASTSIAALSVYEEVPYHEMFGRVEQRRPQIHPNETLAGHARRFIEERTDITHRPDSETFK